MPVISDIYAQNDTSKFIGTFYDYTGQCGFCLMFLKKPLRMGSIFEQLSVISSISSANKLSEKLVYVNYLTISTDGNTFFPQSEASAGNCFKTKHFRKSSL